MYQIIFSCPNFLSFLACLTPSIILSPYAPLLSKPVQFRRSQYFHISSSIKNNCATSISIAIRWTIITCSLICSNETTAGSTVNTNLNDLFIPGKLLSYGTYQFKLTVTMDQSPALTSSAVVYVEIVPSLIMANLVLFGTSFITSAQQRDLVFSPGQFSIHGDEDIFNAKVTYHLKCFLFHLKILGLELHLFLSIVRFDP